jgi:kinetochore protein NDC80
MNVMIRQLVHYLTTHGFGMAVTPKMLAQPSNKDFTNIISFLFTQLDPNFKFTGKFEEEVTSMFRFLGYPYNIAKSNIAAVGSPHAWPTLLGSILWLIELLLYQETNQSNPDEDAELDPSASEKGFYHYLGNAYNLFLSGKDDQYAQLEEQFIQSFENKNILIKDQIETIDKRNGAIAAEIEQIKSRSLYLPELVAKKQEFHNTHSQFQGLLEDLKRHRDQLKEKTELRQTELNSVNNSISALQKEIAAMKDQIQKQELSPVDVQNMVQEKLRLEEAHRVAFEQRQQEHVHAKELEAALRGKVQALEESAKVYYTYAEGLKLVPSSARNARGLELGIEVDIRAKKREGLLKTDVRNYILPALHQTKAELCESTHSLRAERMQCEEEAEELQAQRAELTEALAAAEGKLRRAEAAYKREKDMLDQSTAMHTKEMDAMEARLVQLRDTGAEEAKITAAKRRLAETSAIRAARKAEHDRKKKAMMESIMEVVALCASHRESVQQQLVELKSAYSNRLQMFLSAPPLSSASYQTICDEILNGNITAVDQIFLGQYMPGGNADNAGGNWDVSGTQDFAGNVDSSVMFNNQSGYFNAFAGNAAAGGNAASPFPAMAGSGTAAASSSSSKKVDSSVASVGSGARSVRSANHNLMLTEIYPGRSSVSVLFVLLLRMYVCVCARFLLYH